MTRLGVIVGHSALGHDWDVEWSGSVKRRVVRAVAGDVTVWDAGHWVLLQRHGVDHYTPAHRIDHARNLAALEALDCERVLALSSVGSLRADLGVGSVIVPDDFIALDQPPDGVFEDLRSHVVPGFTVAWRAELVEAWAAVHGAPPIDGGVYWQATGPRFETPAEVRYIATHADVVGMTVATECIAANEIELDYAAICIVDNLANGITGRHLTWEAFEAAKTANRPHVVETLRAMTTALAEAR
jgi:5'-methylthioadenosine phosphorylase